MKIKLSFKDPDWDQDSIYEHVEESLSEFVKKHLTKSELETIIWDRVEKIKDALNESWIEFNEYLNLEYDVEENILKVVKIE